MLLLSVAPRALEGDPTVTLFATRARRLSLWRRAREISGLSVLANVDWSCNGELAGRINLGRHLLDDTYSVLKGVLRNFHCQVGYYSPQGKGDLQGYSHAELANRTSGSRNGAEPRVPVLH
jgi:hypothetical protein